jgi:hypothetical protein
VVFVFFFLTSKGSHLTYCLKMNGFVCQETTVTADGGVVVEQSSHDMMSEATGQVS